MDVVMIQKPTTENQIYAGSNQKLIHNDTV